MHAAPVGFAITENGRRKLRRVCSWSTGATVPDALGKATAPCSAHAPHACRALREFDELGIDSVEMNALLPDAWALRHNLTAHDALYVVLARTLECRLLTLDARMAAAAPDCATLP